MMTLSDRRLGEGGQWSGVDRQGEVSLVSTLLPHEQSISVVS